MSETSTRIALPNRRATKHLARALASAIEPGDLVILSGTLGAGKTFLVRALARALGLPESIRVVSPTFPLLRELPTTPPLAHADLYRLNSIDETQQLGLLELRDDGAVLLVEWGEPHRGALGGDSLDISISLEPRQAQVASTGPRSAVLLAGVMHALNEGQERSTPEERDPRTSR